MKLYFIGNKKIQVWNDYGYSEAFTPVSIFLLLWNPGALLLIAPREAR